MASLSNELLLINDEGILTDEELLLFSTCTKESRRSQLVSKGPRLCFDALDDLEAVSLFRSKTSSTNTREIVCENNTVASGHEGLCITLRRLSYPNRLADLVPVFGRSESEISLIFNETVRFLDEKHGHLLTTLDQQWMHTAKLEEISEAIFQKALLEHCWCFIDGTLMPIAIPSKYQEITFSGHKRIHGLKFQSVVAPNGIIANLYGPLEGKRHDAALLRQSRILPQLQMRMNDSQGHPFYLYGDSAYPLHWHLLGPFKGVRLSPQEEEFNQRMSSVRQCVEWGFSKVIQLFAFLDFRKNVKLYLQPVGTCYRVGCLLTNCHTCLYGSQTGSFFNVVTPTLEQYINNN